MSAFHDNALMGASGQQGYKISRSVRLRSSASAYLNKTLVTATDGKKWTYSIWLKRGLLNNISEMLMAYTGANNRTFLAFSGDIIQFYQYTSGTYPILLVTNAVYRDPSAWYHVVLTYDSTQATSSNRCLLYVNGVQVTSFSTATYPSLNHINDINTATPHAIGRDIYNNTSNFDGQFTEINFIDSQALTPSSFGETDTLTGVWKPKKYAGTYGTNGFYLNFSDNSSNTATTIGKDYSGNGNNWTPNNISVTAGVTYDSMLDVPTPYADGGNGRGNYCVMNPLDWQTTSFPITNGNLTWTSTTTASGSSRGTMGMTTGKWYWEVLATSVGSGSCGVGIAKDGSTNFGSGQALYTSNTGNKYIDGTTTAYGATWATNNMIGIAYDADAGQITFYKDNTSQGAITLSGYAGVNVCPVVSDASSLAFTLDANFGQRPFTYTPPTGFVALNTQNLPAGSITTSGSFTGNASADGPSVYLNGVPTAMTINGNAVTFATHVDKTAYGFKLRTSSSSYNASGSNTYSITTTGAKFKYANAQVNP